MTFEKRDEFLLKKTEEENLSEKNLEDILNLQEIIEEPMQSILGYINDISASAIENNIENEYYLIGGYAVLAHLIEQYGDQVIKFWRGSEDIDMVGSDKFYYHLRNSYNFENDRASPNLKNKRTIKLTDFQHEENDCKIDYVINNKQKKTKEIEILGIPTRVLNPIDLIKSKLSFFETEKKQYKDVHSLLGVCEYKKISAEQLVNSFEHKDLNRLNNFLNYTKEYNPHERITTKSTNSYLKNLKEVIKNKY